MPLLRRLLALAATDLIHILGARGFKDLRTLLLSDGSQDRRDAIPEPGSP
jgi:hypothetical protein